MPYRMHSEYLRRLFLDNDLAEGRFELDGRPVWFTDIRVPHFGVGTVTDHVAPWRSVSKIHLVTTVEITFVLKSGGHNAGVGSEPGTPDAPFGLGRGARKNPTWILTRGRRKRRSDKGPGGPNGKPGSPDIPPKEFPRRR